VSKKCSAIKEKILSKIYVFLPCYNEEGNIFDLVTAWLSEADKFSKMGYTLKITVIDDCSTDSTKSHVQKIAAEESRVEIVGHEINKGLQGGINTAIRRFVRDGGCGDLMFLMDGDNTQEPKYAYKMVEKIIGGNDCVIASRYCKESGVEGLTIFRRFLSDMARVYYTLVLAVPNIRDYTCGYRVYTHCIIKKLVEKYGWEPIKVKSFACMVEFLYKIYLLGGVFGEVGFTLRYDNKKGASKMRILQTTWQSVVTALRLRFFK
jgi:dolichol-phosphate mannosyltransferase